MSLWKGGYKPVTYQEQRARQEQGRRRQALQSLIAKPHSFEEAMRGLIEEEGYEKVLSGFAGVGARFDAADDKGVTLPFVAAARGHGEVLKLLAALGVSVDSPNDTGLRPLFAAVASGNTEAVRVLAQLGASMNTPTHDGTAPIHMAAVMKADAEMVRVLVELGADIKVPYKTFTLLQCAVKRGHAEVARVLLELGAKWATSHRTQLDRLGAVCSAAVSGHADVVRVLVELGEDVNSIDAGGFTPLLTAVTWGDDNMIQVLVSLKANVHKSGKGGLTPLLAAAAMGHAKTIRLLVASLKADIHKAGDDGRSPLATSAGLGHFEATKTLLLLGAPVTMADLKQSRLRRRGGGRTRQLRADLQAWAADALVQHRTFHRTFLFGCAARDGTATGLSKLGGVQELREKVAAFVGIVVGRELRHTRAIGPTIAAIDWAAHDEMDTEESQSGN